jgi:glycerophosphoryl diester phosphodiesterase
MIPNSNKSEGFYAKALKTTALVAFFSALSACEASFAPTNESTVDENVPVSASFPSVLELFSCKPDTAAFIAAHRGTHEGSEYPENTLESLKALHDANVKFAEIDVARLKDGTMILWHDGTWERSSNGFGPIAASTWVDAEKLLTKTTDGQLAAYRPSRFDDVLAWSKNRMYLEVDLKSSANPAKVIEAIHKADMLDQVILIAYSTEQALELHNLAPKAAISVSIFKPGAIKATEVRGIPKSVMTAWTGRGPLTEALVAALRKDNIPILAASFFSLDEELQKSGEFNHYIDFGKNADLVVTDFAFDAQPVLEFTTAQQVDMEKCLKTIKN